jgi:imidazolonepropionase-like amidohydrolase
MSATTTFTNVRIWDGVTDNYLPDADAVQVVDGKITAVGAVRTMGAPGTTRDAAGLTVIPGLIDGHVHLSIDPEIRNPNDQPSGEVVHIAMRARVEKMARAGLTTARDLGGGEWIELAVRDEIRRGETLGPRLVCSGQPITSPGGHCHFWGGEAEGKAQALEVLARQAEKGVDLIKVMATGGNLTPGSTPADAQFDQEVMDAIVKEATARGYHVAAHCHGTTGIRQAAFAGVRTIEHCSWVGKSSGWGAEYDPEVAEHIGANGIFVSPTVNTGWKRFVGSAEREARYGENFDRMRALGIRLIASTDAGIPGVFHHDLPNALPLLSHFAHLSPVEALRAATSSNAEAIGVGDVTGRIAPGLSADLLFVEGDPLADLSALATPVEVMAQGRLVLGSLGTA